MKIGILYPRSNAHPGIMVDYMDALKAALKQQQNNDIQLITESAGLGGNEKEVYEKAEKLLVLEGVDLLVAYIDLRVLEILKPLLLASGKLVLVVNPGANYPQNWVPQPSIINLSLQHGFLCWLTGKLAGQLNYKNASMATTFYDCGYLHTAAMVKGFTNTGGEITYNYVNNQRYDDAFDINQLTGYLSSDKETGALLCIFDSLPSSLFYSRLSHFDGAGRMHLFVSPMMLEKGALDKTGEGFKFPIDGYQAWQASLENNANRIYIDSYFRQTKRDANVFSLLGWETGLILQQVLLLGNIQYNEGAQLVEKLSGIKINSPRGEMKLDPETNYFLAPVYKCSLPLKSVELSIDFIDNPLNEWKEFVGLGTEGVSSGWTNTYLCY